MPRLGSCRALAASAVLLPVSIGCSSSGSSDAPPANQGVVSDELGATLRLVGGPLDGTEVEIPAGALSTPPGATPVTMRLEEGEPTAIAGFAAVGGAVRLTPDGVAFLRPAVATLVFDGRVVPTNAQPDEFVVKFRDDVTGVIRDLEPIGLGLTTGRMTVRLPGTGTLWPVVTDTATVGTTNEYLPLNDNDRYNFERGLTIRVAQSDRVPHLEGTDVRVITIEDGGASFGFYWTYDGGGGRLLWAGEFGLSDPEDQQLAIPEPAEILPATVNVGLDRTAPFDTAYYPRMSSRNPTFFGLSSLRTTVDRIEDVETRLGTFEDCLRVTIRNVMGSGISVQTYRLWLALGVGPVRYEAGLEPARDLITARVGGELVQR